MAKDLKLTRTFYPTPRLFEPWLAVILVLASLALSGVAYGLPRLSEPLVTISYNEFYANYLLVVLGVLIPVGVLSSIRWKFAVFASLFVISLGLIPFFTYFVGPYNPFNFAWSLVVILSYFYGGRILAVLAGLSAVAATTWSLVDYQPHLGAWAIVYIVLSILVLISALTLAFIIIRMVNKSKERALKLTESRAAEALQLSRLNTLLNSISDTVLTLNRYGRVTSENSAALSFFDTNQSLVGKNIDDIIDLKDASLKSLSIRDLAKDLRATLVRDDVSLTSPDAGLMRLSIQLSPIRAAYQDDAGESGVVVIIRDITRQKALEDEKDEFISVTSHELRTPITIAEGSLSNLLFMFDKGAKPEVLKSAVQMAHEQILYLARMTNDLSTLSRAERGVGDATEEINLTDMMHELYMRYLPEAEAKSLHLDLDIGKLPVIETSRLYLEEMLQNFITNAIKYTKEGKVTMAAHVKGGKVNFAVTDSGIGISKTDQAKIFDKFFRSEDYRTRETGGTGLGLYVVRKLADKLSTTIEVKSRLNHGSTFAFSLPAKISDKEIATIEAVESEESKDQAKSTKQPAGVAAK